jgi:hypothetical protein
VANGKKILGAVGCVAAKLLIFIACPVMLAGRGPEPGQRLPSFSLPDQSGATRSFDDLKGPNGLMLVFYRSADW